MITYDADAARKTDRTYTTPDVMRQRMRTLDVLRLRSGEAVLDVGCGSGLLTENLAALVGEQGRVLGIDVSADMLALARQRCAGLPQVELREGQALDLPADNANFDAVVCVQVLLYLPDVAAALAEIHRVLKPGGRIVVLDTDWRSTVLNSADDTITRSVLAAWDAAVPNPNLPARLGPVLRDQGFAAVGVEAFPILNTDCGPDSFSMGLFEQFADFAHKQGTVGETELEAWLADLMQKDADGAYFFCVNRFIFSGVKV